MTKNAKIGIALGVLAILGAGFYVLMTMQDLAPITTGENTSSTTSATSDASPNGTAPYVSNTSSSDQSIDKDTAEIDAQLKGIDTDLQAAQ